jgi:hypothetical protein
MLWK